MSIDFEISTIINASPKELYDAWLDPVRHTAMTGGTARARREVGAAFTAWDGYISGRNLALIPSRCIIQSWRTVEFADDEPDSHLEILFEAHDEGTKVILKHTKLPAHGAQYKQGWVDNYFEPMKRYFEI